MHAANRNGCFGRSGAMDATPTVAAMDIPILAGMVSTVVFAVSNLPMVLKAVRTRDVSSYSFSSMAMINGANVVYSLYVFSLPIGPIWALHTFYLVSCGIMLVLCVRARRSPAHGAATSAIAGSADDAEAALAGGGGLLDLEVAHDGTGRTLGEPVEHRRDVSLLALELGLDGAVGAIAHPTRDAEALGFEARRIPEADALHHPVHDHSLAEHVPSVR